MSAYVILNPGAGSAEDTKNLRAAIKRLGDVTLRETAAPGDAMRFAARALDERHKLVVAAGGDGTINEVVNGLSKGWGAATLGILPLGTGNDFARTIDMPEDVDAAIDIIRRGEICAVDVVCVESDATRYFINVSAGGFSGEVDERLTDELKQRWGPLSYLRAAIGALPDLTNYHMTLQFDNEEPQQLVAYNVVVANARYVAHGVPVAPGALLDDGRMDIVVVSAASLPRLAALIPAVLLGRHLDNPELTCRRARRLHISSKPGMWFNADGELVGNEPMTFTILPRVLRVIVGPNFDARVSR